MRSRSRKMKVHLLRAQNFPTEPGTTRPNIQGAPEARWGCRDYDRSGAIWGSGPGAQQLGWPKGRLGLLAFWRRGACFVSKLPTLCPRLGQSRVPSETGLWPRVLPRDIPSLGSSTSGCGSSSSYPACGPRSGAPGVPAAAGEEGEGASSHPTDRPPC